VSDLKVAKFWVENNTNLDLSFLDGGKLEAYGLGGALMLDYEKFAPTPMTTREFATPMSTCAAKRHAISVSWAVPRARASASGSPAGADRWGMAMDRPVRYVFEVATTRFLGDETPWDSTR
jgi:hypothetical protein